ncbi:vacuolar ATPase assembly integral membrane protein vma21 [Orbilia ellipsospora]|uniref:Vacuolar ATPase assembly integral membrane protein vma21 n=1 Tax=Orbilia ellipsospora TaxID=2528407 RepID=A0AAV9XH94_9PEZI
MATRRNVSKEEKKTEDASASLPAVLPRAMQAEKMKNNPGPAIPNDVLFKLFGFTLAMLIGPIGCYYLSTNYIFPGSTVLGASIAAVMANVVLFAFVIVAMREPDDDSPDSRKNK